jgi:hypothetical protein
MSVLEKTSYEIALRALDQQAQALAELRARTGTLLTAASLIASFLGAQAIAMSGFDGWSALALLSFCVSVALSIYVLLPRDGLIFALDASDAYEALREVSGDEAAIHRALTHGVQAFHERNDPTIERLNRAFGIAGSSLLLEIVLLAAVIVVG